MAEARSDMEFLPDKILIKIFRYLGFKDLQLAEQVCERWKAVVETHFATIKILDLRDVHEDCVELVKRCGPSLQTLFMCEWVFWNKQLHWINYIVEAFPNLKSLNLQFFNIENEFRRHLITICHQLSSMSLDTCTFSEESVGLLLKGLPGLQYLDIYVVKSEITLGECFSNIGDNLKYLSVTCSGNEITTSGLSHLFSKCKKVKTLELKGRLYCDELFSNWCQENVSVRKLVMNDSPMTKMSFSQISRLSLLEELCFSGCDAVDLDTLIDISRGCRNLRRLRLYHHPNICEHPVNSLSECGNLAEMVCSNSSGISEESLVEMIKSGRLKRMEIRDSWISNSGCAAILSHCPQLEELHVTHCKGVVDGIVDIAIEAIENRANGVVLHLYIESTGVDHKKETRTHPLLRVHRYLKDPTITPVRIF